MTYLERLMQDHPNWDSGAIWKYVDEYCPHKYENEGNCPNGFKPCIDCARCWLLEATETENNEREENNMNESTPTLTTRKTKAELLKDIAELKKQVEHLDKYKQLEEAADMTAAMCKSYENAGFSREEAFELTKIMIALAAKTGRR